MWCTEISLDFGVRLSYYVLGSITDGINLDSYLNYFSLSLLIGEMGIIVLTL